MSLSCLTYTKWSYFQVLGAPHFAFMYWLCLDSLGCKWVTELGFSNASILAALTVILRQPEQISRFYLKLILKLKSTQLIPINSFDVK